MCAKRMLIWCAWPQMLRLDFDLTGITTQVEKLAEVIQGAVRPAAQAAAQVYYDVSIHARHCWRAIPVKPKC